MSNIIYFDLETQFTADEVGGWRNKHLMKLAVGVIYSTLKGNFEVYQEKQVKQMIKELASADLVVGFNVKGFDYKVLTPYSHLKLSRLPTLDILEYVYKILGFRISLDGLAYATLGENKSSNGAEAVKWYRGGAIDKVIEYCKQDVKLTRDLHNFGMKKGYLLYYDKRGIRKKELPVKWKEKHFFQGSLF